jgi:hypothetical protein
MDNSTDNLFAFFNFILNSINARVINGRSLVISNGPRV